MNKRRSIGRRLGALAAIGVLASTAVAFAPTAVGGQMTYIIVTGNSMEPTFHSGDLIVARDTDAFRVGDVAVYRHPQIGRVVHRIIGRDGQNYVFQGDNNGFVDGYRPRRADLVGAAWFSVPGAGVLLKFLREPLQLTILTVLSLAGLGGGLATLPGRKRPVLAMRRRRLVQEVKAS